MKAKQNQEELLVAIELVCKELLNADTINVWYDVRERPLNKIMSDIGLNKHFSSCIYDELKSIGLIEKEGNRGGLRYKIITNTIPDATTTAKNILQRYNDKIAESVTATKKSDLQPFYRRNKSACDLEFDECKKKCKKVKTDYSRVPHLGQIVYALVNGYITEAKITCVRFDEVETTKVRVDFVTAIVEEDDDFGGGVHNVIRKNYCLRNIAFSVDELIKKMQQNVKKFK